MGIALNRRELIYKFLFKHSGPYFCDIKKKKNTYINNNKIYMNGGMAMTKEQTAKEVEYKMALKLLKC
ncbi:MAG: hypothetical protein RBR71_14175 [Gudongella sp.]|nr:hypothetical protein [Gudongella sp.]